MKTNTIGVLLLLMVTFSSASCQKDTIIGLNNNGSFWPGWINIQGLNSQQMGVGTVRSITVVLKTAPLLVPNPQTSWDSRPSVPLSVEAEVKIDGVVYRIMIPVGKLSPQQAEATYIAGKSGGWIFGPSGTGIFTYPPLSPLVTTGYVEKLPRTNGTTGFQFSDFNFVLHR